MAKGFEQRPLTPGTIVGKVAADDVRGTNDLTPQEREVLLQAGYNPGDPLPDLSKTAVGRRLQRQADQIRKGAENIRGLTPVDPSTPPLPPPEFKDIDTLPPAERELAEESFKAMRELSEVAKIGELSRSPEQQALVDRMHAEADAMSAAGTAVDDETRELQQAVAAAKAQVDEEVLSPTLQQVPGAQAAIAVANRAAEKDVTLIDDLSDEAPARPAFSLKRKEPEPEISSHEQNLTGSDISEADMLCPRCGYAMDDEAVVITETDKIAYIACIMGQLSRFRKEYSLYDGRVHVTFRALLPRELDAAVGQADRDMADGKIATTVQYIREAETYKVYAAIERIVRGDKRIEDIPPIDELEVEDDETRPPIVVLREHLDNEIFTMDNLRRAVYAKWADFNNILIQLETKADDPSFFKGIE